MLCSGNDELSRHGAALTLKQDVAQAVRATMQGLTEERQSDFYGNLWTRPSFKSIIQLQTKEDEIESFYVSIQEETDHIP